MEHENGKPAVDGDHGGLEGNKLAYNSGYDLNRKEAKLKEPEVNNGARWANNSSCNGPRRFEDLDIHDAAAELGGEVQRDDSILCPGPDHDPEDRSLKVTRSETDAEGFVCHSFADDDWKVCRAYVSETLRLSNAPRPPLSDAEQAEWKAKREARAKIEAKGRAAELADWTKTWNGAAEATEEGLVGGWFKGRGLKMPLGVLRAKFYPIDCIPCGTILARIVDPITGELCGFHRTYIGVNPCYGSVGKKPININGQLKSRLYAGSSKGVIRLIEGAENNRTLMVGEGIETALSLAVVLGMECAAIWATGDCNNLKILPPLDQFDEIVIAVDIEPSGAGWKASRKLAECWAAAGKRVCLVVPVLPEGKEKYDLNDVVQAEGGPRLGEDGNYRIEEFEARQAPPSDCDCGAGDIGGDGGDGGGRDDGGRDGDGGDDGGGHSVDNAAIHWPDVTKDHRPRATLRNAKMALEYLGLSFSFDVFHKRKYVQGHSVQEYAGELSDDLCASLRDMVLTQFGFDLGEKNTRDALNILCLQNRFHPIRDYLDGLAWDGMPRLEKWLNKYLGAEDNELNSAIGRIVLIAAVRRVRKPGCKFDTIPVLEGEQNTGKSSAVAILAGQENFSDSDILALDAKAQVEALEGVWIYELAELDGMKRADVTRIKAFASRQTDRARAAYARFREDRPREGIFIGTTNEAKYLRDTTGNRRWWPIKTAEIDLDGLRADRDQLWAEAAQLETMGASLLLPRKLLPLAVEEQSKRLEDEPWEDILSTDEGLWIEEVEGEQRVKSQTLLSVVLKIPEERQTVRDTKRLGAVMRKLGWKGPKPMHFPDGRAARGYWRLKR